MEFLDAYESRVTLFRSSSRRSEGGARNEHISPTPSALAGLKRIRIPYHSATRFIAPVFILHLSVAIFLHSSSCSGIAFKCAIRDVDRRSHEN
jgi:hypothetical protein